MFEASQSCTGSPVLSPQAGSAGPGALTPKQAWALVVSGQARLVDVRTAEERKFVGLPPRSVHVPWATGMAMTLNPRFIEDLAAKVGRDDVVVLLCRSGKRSALAAQAAFDAGFSRVFNILEGFEGDLDDESHRGGFEGWRYCGLPWVQE